MKKAIFVSPHPDDETLGCGGVILKYKNQGYKIYWLIVTGISEALGFTSKQVKKRSSEIESVADIYGFDSVYQLEFPTTKLDTIPLGDIVKSIGDVFKQVQPNFVYLPYRGDVHTDHAIVFDAVISCTKWFRFPHVERILAYETLSETEFGLNPDQNYFRPNVFVDISSFLEEKIKIMRIFESEIGEFPFPRSEVAICSLAKVRGVASGFKAAEAFMLLRERCRD